MSTVIENLKKYLKAMLILDSASTDFESLERRWKDPRPFQFREAISTYHAADFYSGAISLANVKHHWQERSLLCHLEAFEGLVQWLGLEQTKQTKINSSILNFPVTWMATCGCNSGTQTVRPFVSEGDITDWPIGSGWKWSLPGWRWTRLLSVFSTRKVDLTLWG